MWNEKRTWMFWNNQHTKHCCRKVDCLGKLFFYTDTARHCFLKEKQIDVEDIIKQLWKRNYPGLLFFSTNFVERQNNNKVASYILTMFLLYFQLLFCSMGVPLLWSLKETLHMNRSCTIAHSFCSSLWLLTQKRWLSCGKQQCSLHVSWCLQVSMTVTKIFL